MVVVEDITMEPHIMERHIMGAMEEVGEVVTMVEAMAGVVINLLPRHLREEGEEENALGGTGLNMLTKIHHRQKAEH